MKKVFLHAFLIVAVCLLLGLGLNFGLIQQFLSGDFLFGFLSSEDYPSIAFITLQEAEDLFSLQEALFIDSRNGEAFRDGHIVGAISVPYEEKEDTRILAEIDVPRERTIVVYCDGSECQSSIGLAKRLHDEGFTHLKVFFGGWEEWLRAGLPITTGNDE